MPTLYVIAGPNGIGKTTSCYDIIPSDISIINSDEIAKEIRNAGLTIHGNTQEYSNYEAIQLMEEQRRLQNSFAIETNLADTETWKFLVEIQTSGYEVQVLYISTNNIEILNKRINERTLRGEHYVKPDIVEERYVTGLKLLNHYFSKPDKLQLFDNSENIYLLAEISKGKIIYSAPQPPDWIINYLGEHFNNPELKHEIKIKDMSDIEEVRNAYEKLKQKH